MVFQELEALIKDHKLTHDTRFHKEEYIEGHKDTFVHLDMKTLRKLANKYKDIYDTNDFYALLKHEYHEYRLLALLIMIHNYNKNPKDVFNTYNQYIDYVDNWDLVDVSAGPIVGRYAYDHQLENIIENYGSSQHMWINRIAIVSTHYFIRKESLKFPLKIIKKLLEHHHDLIHKANGWMLREIGKVDIHALNQFIKVHYQNIPRTTLRYAIEKHDKKIRKLILGGDFSWI
jgi:3-methyladenine DNA glycosylase AlkD